MMALDIVRAAANKTFSPEQIRAVYDSTVEGSRLRLYFVTVYALLDSDKMVSPERYPQEFLADVSISLNHQSGRQTSNRTSILYPAN
jgi:hypothetical protein